MSIRLARALMLVACVPPAAAMVQPNSPSVALQANSAVKTLDLTQPFHTRSAWHLIIRQETPVSDSQGDQQPGKLTLCLQKGHADPCIAAPVTLPLNPPDATYLAAWEPHYLIVAKVVYPQHLNGAPFLLLVTSSLMSADGDRLVATQLIAYDPAADEFHRVFGRTTGHNNNQEIRFVTSGPLQGSVIAAEPQEHPPYGYWIVVSQLTSAGQYHQVLRYGSATRYGDNNPLSVIDSEMPNIEKHLGIWKPGDPIPVPDGKKCPHPVLVRTELWCR